MPGRQAHGRPLISQPKAKAAPKRSKARAQKTALNAFNIAQEQFPTKIKRTPRARELDVEIERKHARDEGDDDDDDAGDGDDAEDDEDRGPKRKKVKGPSRAAAGDDGVEYGSDSEGNEWRLGGLAEDDEDSEIESDEAFGESDNDMFQGYAFRGSRVQARKDDDDEDSDDSNDDQGATLGEEAIDLATALDQFEEESDAAPEGQGQEASGSDEDDDDEDDEDDDEEEEEEEEESDDADDESDEEADPERLKELQGLISGFGGQADAKDPESAAPRSQKISLQDLGLMGLSDPSMKRSIRLMKKEDKDTRPGAGKKLDVPLSRREQGRLDRAAAYEKTNETLDRWTETVKANRRAEHLVFPLPQESESHGVDRNEISLVSAGAARNELESAILSIMEQSGLSMERTKKNKDGEAGKTGGNKQPQYDEEGNLLTRKQVLEHKRMERELASREAKRAKRIKKIKSKAYHRVHRKQRERDEMATAEARAEAGEVDSEEEREAHDRRRALERVGQRHKESKWAKMGARNRRAVWDDDFREGLTEMARKDEELRRRKEGKGVGGDGDDSDDTSSSGSDDDEEVGGGAYSDRKLRRQLDELEREGGDAPQSRLMGMKFMQKAEAAKKKANDDLIRQIRRELDGEDADDGADSAGDEEKGDAGRRQFGVNTAAENPFAMSSSRTKQQQRQQLAQQAQAQAQAHGHGEDEDDDDVAITTRKAAAQPTPAETTASLAGAWSRGETRRKKHTRADDLALNDHILTASQPSSSSPKPSKSKSKSASQPSSSSSSKPSKSASQPSDANPPSSDDEEGQEQSHMPLAIRDQALVARAFAGEDVVAAFEREKEQVASDDDDKVIDNTLPGWGSWVGEGVSAREKRRHQGRFLTKVEGVKKKDRKDAKLERVIINEKRVKKNDQFLASQLPHMFESRQQYERSLRLPVGPEWMTKESFQDSTRPRVLIKQGVIAPMSKPTV